MAGIMLASLVKCGPLGPSGPKRGAITKSVHTLHITEPRPPDLLGEFGKGQAPHRVPDGPLRPRGFQRFERIARSTRPQHGHHLLEGGSQPAEPGCERPAPHLHGRHEHAPHGYHRRAEPRERPPFAQGPRHGLEPIARTNLGQPSFGPASIAADRFNKCDAAQAWVAPRDHARELSSARSNVDEVIVAIEWGKRQDELAVVLGFSLRSRGPCGVVEIVPIRVLPGLIHPFSSFAEGTQCPPWWSPGVVGAG